MILHSMSERLLIGTEQVEARKNSRGLRYYIKRTVIYAVSFYVGLVLLVYVFQRKLMYPAHRTDSISLERAGLSPRDVRDVRLKTSDGVTLGGWHYRPSVDRAGSGKLDFDEALKGSEKVVLYFHGNGGHRGHAVDLYQTLARQGMHTFALDYRGFGDSEGSASEDGLAEDARSAWRWLKAKGVSHKRLILYGQSLGCAVAIRLALELQENDESPLAMILESPFSTMVEAAAKHYWFLPVRWIVWDRYPSIDRIGRIHCPLLIYHGHKDGVVPFDHGKRIFETAPLQSDSGIEKRFVEIPEAGHNDIRYSFEELHKNELKAFLEKIEAVQK